MGGEKNKQTNQKQNKKHHVHCSIFFALCLIYSFSDLVCALVRDREIRKLHKGVRCCGLCCCPHTAGLAIPQTTILGLLFKALHLVELEKQSECVL